MRGRIEECEERPGTPLLNFTAFLPVLESFTFTPKLREATSGQAFPQMIFSHYEQIPGNSLVEGTQANDIIMEVRKRKGMKNVMPEIGQYHERV